MRRSGTIRRNSSWLTAFAIAVFLRALIAPGFMLDVGGSGPFGLQIVLCDGPAGIAALAEGNHANHHAADTAEVQQSHDDHGNEHLSATCGMWMSSSVFVAQATIVVENPQPLEDQFFVCDDVQIVAHKHTTGEHPPRAPPKTLLA